MNVEGFARNRKLSFVDTYEASGILKTKGFWPEEDSFNWSYSSNKGPSYLCAPDQKLQGLSLFRVFQKKILGKKEVGILSFPVAKSWAPVAEVLKEDGSHRFQVGVESDPNEVIYRKLGTEVGKGLFTGACAVDLSDPVSSKDRISEKGSFEVSLENPKIDSEEYGLLVFVSGIIAWMRGREQNQNQNPIEF